MRTTSPKLDTSRLTANEEADLRCRTALELKEKGEYEAARKVMFPLWQGIGSRPDTKRLDADLVPRVLLCAGILTGWLGGISIRLFEAVSDSRKAADAKAELAQCYWRAGDNDTARILLSTALERLTVGGNARAKALLILSSVLCFLPGNYVVLCQDKNPNATSTSVQRPQGKPNPEPGTANKPRLTEEQRMAIGELNTLIKESIATLSEAPAERLYGLGDLASQSSLLVWKYDAKSAGEGFKDLTATLLDMYEKDRREKADEERIAIIRRSLKNVISLWSRNDAKSAIAVLDRLNKLEEELNSGSNPRGRASEQFELANTLLETDPQQSAVLAERVIEIYVPDRFPEYLSKLRQLDPASSDRVLRRSLAVLATGQVYSFKHDLILQAYVHREPMIVYPVKGPIDFPGFESLPFPVGGVLTLELIPGPANSTDRNELAEYTNASINALNRRLTSSKGVSGLDAATAYFLIQKLQAYFELSHTETPFSLMTLQRVGATVATSNGVSRENLTHFVTLAREVVSQNFLKLLAGNVSTAAEKSTDPSLKTRVIETEILADIHDGKFDAADAKIFKLDDLDSREMLADYLQVAKIKDALKKRDWITIDGALDKIHNWNVRSYALLECARTVLKVDQVRTSQFLHAARQIIEGKLGVNEQSQMMTGLLAVYAESNSSGLEEILSITARAINRPFEEDESPPDSKGKKGMQILRYLGNDVGVYGNGVAGGAIRYQMKATSLETAFAGAGKRDWTAAYSVAREIKFPALRSKAILGVCRAIL